MSKLVICKAYDKEVTKGAKCPNCGYDQRNFFVKHKVLTVILVLVIIGGFGSAMNGTKIQPKDAVINVKQNGSLGPILPSLLKGTAVNATPRIKVTAQSIVNELKTKESRCMTNITVTTAANDENKLLGRPNQYTEKITWNDNRATDTDNECTIEVFNNKEDATARYKYVTTVDKTLQFAVQYITQKNNAVLRIEGALTPAQAKEYTDIFNKN